VRWPFDQPGQQPAEQHATGEHRGALLDRAGAEILQLPHDHESDGLVHQV
jgi:hypothetical protein